MNIFQVIKESVNTIIVKYIKNEEIESMPIFYIGGSQTLPPPLLPEEEKAELEKLAAGDESVRQTLVERNLRLVVYIAKKFENTGIGIEDLISIGTIGLAKGVNTFRRPSARSLRQKSTSFRATVKLSSSPPTCSYRDFLTIRQAPVTAVTSCA